MDARVAIVTGATRGIGNGLFQELCRQGVSVATIYHGDEEAASRFVRDAERAGVGHLIRKCDVIDGQGLDAFAGEVVRAFGRVDYLVNNVGVDIFKTVADMTWDDWTRSQDVILNAPVRLCRAVLPVMRRNGFGRIVNLGASSKDYFKGNPGLGPFGIHKAALTVFTRTLALEEIRHGITVNMVAPGSTDGAGTIREEKRIPRASIPIGRRVAVSEVVEAIAFFLSDGAGAVTGQVLGVNGGLST